MPNLNASEGFRELPATPGATRPQRQRGGGISAVIVIVAVIIMVGVGAFLLDTFGIVHLWGEKAPPEARQELPPPVPAQEPAVVDTQAGGPPEVTEPPEITELPEVTKPPEITELSEVTEPAQVEEPPARRPRSPTGAGDYAFQVSSWRTMGKAQEEASRLKSAGFDSFVDQATTDAATSYRVLIGTYGTASEAKQAAEEFAPNWEGGYYVIKIKQ
ncbi:MAG: SPOR domain-containing protein [Bacteroidota bacterium]